MDTNDPNTKPGDSGSTALGGDDLAVVYSRAQVGIDAPLVTVEAHLSTGLPSLSIVGLPEATVKESKDRVRAAVLNSRYDFPMRRLTINLAPADLPKVSEIFLVETVAQSLRHGRDI